MGSIIRSGGPMCRKMTQFIDPDTDLTIVELGAGDGAITSYILEKMAPNSTLLVFEINPELCTILSKIDDKRMILINDGAENLDDHLTKHGIAEVDMIISAIPFLVLPDDITNKILTLCSQMLKKGGIFVQMHYIKAVKTMYKRIFGNVHTYFVPVNIPPGYVFKCVKEN
jgi:phospholipid N-methyltransferase